MEIIGTQYGRWEVIVRGMEVWVYVTVLPVQDGETSTCTVCGADVEVSNSVHFEKVIEAYTEDWPASLSKKEKAHLAEHILEETCGEGCHSCARKLAHIRSIEEGRDV